MSKKTKASTRIVFVGGHMTPALALAEKLQKEGYHNLLWIGQKYSQTGDRNKSIEYRRVSRLNIKFINLTTGKLWRRWTKETFFKGVINLLLVPIGFLKASWFILRYRPDVIIGFGSYLMVPILLQIPLIKLLKTKTYIHEQTIKPSLSSKITEKHVDKIFLTWQASKKYFDNNSKIVTGNPIEQEFLTTRTEKPIFSDNNPILLIIGGNQGANTFNRRLRDEILPKYLGHFNIVHQTGRSTITRDYELALKEKASLPKKLQSRYQVFDFIDPRLLNHILGKATLLLSRSGANTVQKVLLKGVPTLFMPLPWSSNDEQLENAKLAESVGIGEIFKFKSGLTDVELYERIMKAYKQTLENKSFIQTKTWKEAKADAKKLVKLDATDNIYKELDL